MSFPCPHCGGTKSFDERNSRDFSPIIPSELQDRFDEPPPLNSTETANISPVSAPTQAKAPETIKSSSSRNTELKERSSTTVSSIPKSSRSTINSPITTVAATKDTVTIQRRLERIETAIKGLKSDMKKMLRSQKVVEESFQKVRKIEKKDKPSQT